MIKIISFIFILILSFPVFPQETIVIPVTEFNPASLKKTNSNDTKWSQLTLPKRSNTKYKLVKMDSEPAIRAISENSASGLIYKVEIDPEEYPIIEWRWKVDQVIDQGNLQKKKGDDYPARIYITFDYDKTNLSVGERIKYESIRTFSRHKVPLRAINYIWANKAEEGTIAPNPYTDWVYMIAVETGDGDNSGWQSESRNIYIDYKKAFGEDPPVITGVAIMTDSDDTGSRSKAYYGDIIFKKTR